MFGDLLGRPTDLSIWPYTRPWLIRERTAQSATGNGAGGQEASGIERDAR